MSSRRWMTGNLTSMTVILVRSRIECTVKCLENTDCCMSSYNRDTNACTIDLSGCCDATTGQADDTDIMIKLEKTFTLNNNIRMSVLQVTLDMIEKDSSAISGQKGQISRRNALGNIFENVNHAEIIDKTLKELNISNSDNDSEEKKNHSECCVQDEATI
ncbi:unnamed protein product [Mytilus edulis]|uniref:Uncharacterized protein n=1 Tax=Mytilus edulis TaxID=6550 RepID=A0A8S3RSE2_MYTED|nr:unnamed protein product [Mytilus edulis]